MGIYTELRGKIRKKEAVVTIMGLGYVGLPIAIELCKIGFRVNGLDNNLKRLRKLRNGESYIDDISSKEIKDILKTKSFHPVSKQDVLAASDVIIVCVPTPLRKVKEPDISYIVQASRSLRKYLRPGQLIIIESTTYPGTTREVILPILEKSGFAHDTDYFLAFSPERIDPGNPKYGLVNIPKVVGGITKKGTELGAMLYSSIIKKVVKVPDAETAEVSKLLENTFRIVNIGLINEFSMLCGKLGIDVWEVIKAASTKPFGFFPFYPGPGIGGHCIPADPMYLSWKARKVGFETKMIDLAAKINRMIPKYVVKRSQEALKEVGKKLKGADLLVIGVAYKKDVNDLRESPSLDIIEGLMKKGAKVSYHDDFIPYLRLHGLRKKSIKLTDKNINKKDLVLLVTDHSYLDYKKIADQSPLILDTRNIFQENKIKKGNIIKL